MLVLTQGKEIPVLKRALLVFETILTKKSLHLIPQSQSQDSSMAESYASLYAHASIPSSQSEQCEDNTLFDINYLGFDFMDEWQIEQMDYTGRY
jgi:hypothetical protein